MRSSPVVNVGIDIDGVIYPWHYSVYRYHVENKGYGGNIVEFWRDYFPKLGSDYQRYIVNLDILYDDTTPKPDILNTLPLIAEKFGIYYITHRPYHTKRMTEKFFNNYNLPFKENLIFTPDKPAIIRRYNIRYFVDDQGKNLDEVAGITEGYLFPASHNVSYRDKYNCVTTLREFYNIINQKNLVKELGYV